MKKMADYLQIAFLIAGALTVFEFIFIRGMFTWLIAVAATVIIGTINITFSLIHREWLKAAMFLLTTVSLCMGYFVIM